MAQNPLIRQFMAEDRTKGRLSFKTINAYVRNTGGWFLLVIFFFITLCATYMQNYAIKFLLAWSNVYEEHVDEKWQYLGKYALLIYSYCFIGTSRFAIYLYLGVRLSRKLHSWMLFRVAHAPVEEFLELVPMGRILNRFSKDVNVVDKILMKNTCTLIFSFVYLLSQFYFMVISLDILVLIPLLCFFCASLYVQRLSMRVKREVVRLEAVSKSPIVGWAGQTLKGLPQLRTMRRQGYCTQRMLHLLESNIKNSVAVYGLDGWFSLRVSLLSLLLVQVPCFSYIVYKFRGTPDVVDLSVFVLLSSIITEEVLRLLTLLSDSETNLISIERLDFFSKIPFERGYTNLSENKRILPKKNQNPFQLCMPFRTKIATKGEVIFEEVSARYGENARPVLKDLNFKALPGEKIGIVGRTGAGKSSLIKLFWLSLRPYKGRVLIDGIDIGEKDLKSVRNEIMVVSQDSALFQGTLRENIDPTLTKEKDPEVLGILRRLGFKNKAVEKKGLDAQVDSDGSNFSKGEAQVICYARILVNKRKVIILDEATANVDVKTEQAIQRAQDSEFKDSTMFIIAHRINTVMNCDRIMVLKFGEIVEMDSPENLLQDEDSYFKLIYDKMREQEGDM